MQSSGMIGMKLATEFLRRSSSRESFLFVLAHLNMRMLMDSSSKFVKLLQYWNIRAGLKDYQIKPKIGLNDNWWAHLSKDLIQIFDVKSKLVNPA